MKKKEQRFPLPLSSLTHQTRVHQAYTHHPYNIQTPQTATQNAERYMKAHHAKREEGREYAYSHPPVISHKTFLREKMAELSAPRRAMVLRLAQSGITDEAVLDAMQEICRHQFVDTGLSAQAYADAPLPIGYQQTISQPFIVARMVELMRNKKKLGNVLEIGTGCGYQAAVLAKLCVNVYSIERIEFLYELAKKNVRHLRLANLRLHYGDGTKGLPQLAPFDGIILAAAGEDIPETLLHQLAIGGRLIAPVGRDQQALHLLERTGETSWSKTTLDACYFVPLCEGSV